jgi:ribosome-binding protein aMBF1 (putative translation factor)
MNRKSERASLANVVARIRDAVPEVAEAEARLGSRLVVARNVMRLRIQRGWTQARLAEEMGVRQPRVAQIENAAANFRLDTLDAVAKAFGVAPVSLLDDVARKDLLRPDDAPEPESATSAA